MGIDKTLFLWYTLPRPQYGEMAELVEGARLEIA